MNILLAGVAGFIGSNLALYFLKKNYCVIGIDNFITGDINNIKMLKAFDGFDFICKDICDLKNVDGEIDWVLHFASPSSQLQYYKYPIETMKANSEGCFNLLEIARQKKAKFLFASTSEIYGDPKVHPQIEQYWGNVNPIGKRSCYDESKRFGEALIYSMRRQYNLSVRVIRIFNTYGPRMQLTDGRVITNFIDRALKRQPLNIYGTGMQTRSFQYIDDLVIGIYKVMESNYTKPINIGNPEEYTILEMSKILEDVCGYKLEIRYKELPEDDPMRRKPDITLAENVLKWRPQISLKQGLEKTWIHFLEYSRKVDN